MELKCLLNPGNIITLGFGMSLKYIDQLDKGQLISRQFMNKYLNNKYSITPQEYYNIVVYGDIEFIPVCPYCNKPRKFWRLISGYYETCCDSNCISNKHSDDNRLRWSRMTEEEYINFCKKLGFANNPMLRASAEVNRLLKLFDSKSTWYLYLAIINKTFKFGISQNPLARSIKMGYDSIHVIRSGSLIEIANSEYEIKEFRNSPSEYFPPEELHTILNFIRSIDR